MNPKLISINTVLPNKTRVILQRHSVFGGGIIKRVFNETQKRIETSYRLWKNGMLIQNAFPYLTPSEREFFLTGLSTETEINHKGQA